jgi:hypothetical protein
VLRSFCAVFKNSSQTCLQLSGAAEPYSSIKPNLTSTWPFDDGSGFGGVFLVRLRILLRYVSRSSRSYHMGYVDMAPVSTYGGFNVTSGLYTNLIAFFVKANFLTSLE